MHERGLLRDRTRIDVALAVGQTYAIAFGLIGFLVWVAGPWAVAANTRFLDLLYRTGMVRLTDADQGYFDGAPGIDYFIKSQDWIDWRVVGLAALLLVAVWAMRAARFHTLATTAGIDTSLRRDMRVHLYGEEMGRFLPYELGTAAALAAYEQDHGERTQRLESLVRLVRVAEIAFFALVTVFLVGFASWFGSMAWALIVLAAATYLATGRVRSPWHAVRNWYTAARSAVAGIVFEPSRALLVGIVTLVSFPLEEVVAYFIVQSFTSEHVVLGGATPSVLLLALVAGKLATQVRLTPGGLGQFEWAFAASLVASGQGLAEAVTITLLFSAVRYVTGGIVLAATSIGAGPGTSASEAIRWTLARDESRPSRLPGPALLGGRLLVIGYVVAALMLLGRLRELLVDYWLFESLGFDSVFWTNFRVGAVLFVVGGLAWAAAVGLPALRHRLPANIRRDALRLAVLFGVAAAVWWAGKYQTFILAFNGVPFDVNDPVFGNDLGLYVYRLPAIETVVSGLTVVAAVALVAHLLVRLSVVSRDGTTAGRLAAAARDSVSTGLLAIVGLSGAVWVWIGQYDVLVKDNYYSSIASGAEALDVTGFLSTVNAVRVEALMLLGLTASVIVWARRAGTEGESARSAARMLVPWVLVAIAFPTGVAIRDITAVRPNEPVIQLEHIERHIDATNAAWGMDQIELVDFRPNGAGDPLPEIGRVLDHPAVRNAQLWPGAVSWLERLLDPQHVERILLEAEEKNPDMVFGATPDIFKQQQKLRAYYDFIDVDVTRYQLEGEPTLVASSVRELPLLEPHPWLAYWGQRFVLFTHGHGLVAAPLGQVTDDGAPRYVSSGIPPEAVDPVLVPGSPAIYYGEGSGNIGFSNIRNMPELDYPTDQGREDVFLPADVNAGVRIDSFVKRLAFAWGTTELFDAGSLFDVGFSRLIDDGTRIHYERQPLERLRTVAPFLFLDADPYAVVGPDSLVWMVNGLTTTDRYPYSAFAELGDKSVRRTPFPTEVDVVNYAADSVKATVDAYTGQVRLYQISDEPIVSSWARAYPALFAPATEMPPHVERHRQFPTQLFHAQFDDLFIYYHVTEPLPYFNQEDLFDDADEVLGPMVQEGEGITFSMEPYPSILETGTDFPASSSGTQFALNQIFTPEGALNLRALVSVYQDGDDYGRLSMLQVPKGYFVHGPEQAEAVIDQDELIAQQFGFWNSTGVEVLRGYLTPVVIDGEVMYIEPVFIRSVQNPYPQLNRIVVVARGEAVMAPTVAEAIGGLWERLAGDA